MSSLLILAREVSECAMAAGYEITPADQTTDGRAVFTGGLGETSFLVGIEPDGIVTVNESDRLQPEYMVFAAPALSTVERYLLMTFGSTTRFRRKLPRIRIPVDKDHVALGFDLATKPFRDGERLALISTEGKPIAWGRNDPIIATVVLTELSYHMTGSMHDIAESYFSSSGSPLFHPFVRGETKS